MSKEIKLLEDAIELVKRNPGLNVEINFSFKSTGELVQPIESTKPVEKLEEKSKPEIKKETKKPEAKKPEETKRVEEDKPEALKPVILQEGQEHCIACDGTGKNSKGGSCVPCKGTGIAQKKVEIPAGASPDTAFEGNAAVVGVDPKTKPEESKVEAEGKPETEKMDEKPITKAGEGESSEPAEEDDVWF